MDLNILEKVKQGKGSQTWIDKAQTVSRSDNAVMQCNSPLFLSSSNQATFLVAWWKTGEQNADIFVNSSRLRL